MGLFNEGAAIARRFGLLGEIPARALELSGQSLAAVEAATLRFLWARIGETVPEARQLSAAPSARQDGPEHLMSSLLARSLEQNTAASKQDYYRAVVAQLVPDEARILAALADGEASPLVTVFRRGGGGEKVLENASLIGRTAAVTLPSMTTKYVTHLFELGLVEAGPEDQDNQRGYELVLAEKDVRAALKEGELSKLPARVQRRTLRLSAHGRDLWAATRPGGDA